MKRTHLAEFKQENGDPRPLDLGRRASCDTRTESMKIEPVSDTRSATLFLIAGAVKPFRPCVVFNEILESEFKLFELPCPK